MSCSRAAGARAAPRRPALEGDLPLHELARLRHAVYRVLTTVLLYPDAEWIAILPRVAGELLAETRPLSRFAFWPAWEGLLRSLRGMEGADRAALEAAYVGAFMVSPDGAPSLPYESAYYPPEAVGEVLASLDQEYARAGFSVASSFKEPPDHAAVELEFMGLLCQEEAEMWEREDLAGSVERLRREQRFLERHLARWFPEFARRAAELDGGAFYGLATGAARDFLAHDVDLVAALLGRYREGAGT